jgi:flagellar basal-body rod protein FlgC
VNALLVKLPAACHGVFWRGFKKSGDLINGGVTMTFSVSSSLSALQAFSEKMAVTANNVANLDTEEFKKSRALLKEGPRGDVHAEISRVETPGPTVVEYHDGQITERELSNVDLAEEIPQTILAQRYYKANLIMIRTQEEMVGTVIDLLS